MTVGTSPSTSLHTPSLRRRSGGHYRRLFKQNSVCGIPETSKLTLGITKSRYLVQSNFQFLSNPLPQIKDRDGNEYCIGIGESLSQTCHFTCVFE